MNKVLKIALIDANKSQIEVAVQVGIDEGRMSKIVRGWIEPRPEERERIAKALGRDETELWPERTGCKTN